MSRLPKQTEFVVFIQKTPVATLHCSSQQTLQRHTEIVSSSLSEIYNPDLLDPEEKEHLVEVFDSDKDIDIDNHCTNRTLRAGQFQNCQRPKIKLKKDPLKVPKNQKHK